MGELDCIDPEALRRMARCAKGAAAGVSAVADAHRDVTIEYAASRSHLAGDGQPASWEVEREAFMRRLHRRLDR